MASRSATARWMKFYSRLSLADSFFSSSHPDYPHIMDFGRTVSVFVRTHPAGSLLGRDLHQPSCRLLRCCLFCHAESSSVAGWRAWMKEIFAYCSDNRLGSFGGRNDRSRRVRIPGTSSGPRSMRGRAKLPERDSSFCASFLLYSSSTLECRCVCNVAALTFRASPPWYSSHHRPCYTFSFKSVRLGPCPDALLLSVGLWLASPSFIFLPLYIHLFIFKLRNRRTVN